MPRLSRFSIAKKDIVTFFDNHPSKIFKKQDLSDIYEMNRESWRLAASMYINDFIEEMVKKTKLKEVKLPFPYGKLTLYVYGETSVYQLALALKPRAYFSHYTALAFHQLTEQLPKTLYVTFEQSEKHFERQPLLQKNIDNAFAKKQRVSENHVPYKGYTLYLLNGKHTDNEGVVTIEHPLEGELEVTNLERTLIDIAVRPAYSGGISEVLKAYGNAKEKISVNKLNAMLKRIDFVYPYHQVIGFYMERAGYRDSQLDLLKKHGFKHKLYLAYDMQETAFSETWQLYYPKGF
ncbi:MAG: hypothetical protein KDC54_02860 [Lewinella sp.]|nr:hypothetical protein [Lewinella sp.]